MRLHHIRPIVAVFAVLCLTAAPAAAQTNYWWNSQGGAGTWDTATQNWSTASGGALNYTWTNSGTERANIGGTATAGTITLGAPITAYGLVFTTTGYTITANTLTLAGAGGIINTNTVSATISSIIADSGGVGLTKSGTGTLTLSGANTYTGATNVSAGVLSISNASALGTTAGATTVASGAALQVSGGITVAEALTLTGTGVSGAGALRSTTGTNTWSGAITLATSAGRINTDAGTLTISGGITATDLGLTVGGAGNTVISSAINTGTGTLTKDGTGTVTLSATNGYTGTTTITAGVLQFNSPLAIGGSGTSVTVTSPGAASAGYAIDQAFLGRIDPTSTGTVALGLNSANDLDFSAAGANLTAARLGANVAATYSGTLTPNGTTYRLGGGGGTLTMANALVDVAGTTNLDVGVAGNNGTVVITQPSSYTGTTTVNGGTLNFSSIAGVGGSGVSLTLNSPGVMGIAGFVVDQAFVNRFTSGSNGTLALAVDSSNNLDFSAAGGNSAVRLGASATVTYSGTLTPNGTTYRLGGGGGTLTMTNPLVNVGGTTNLDVGVSGLTGVVILPVAATYTGTTTINGGTLRAGASNVFATGAYTVNGGTLDLNATSQTISSLAGTGGTVLLPTGSTLTIAGTASTSYAGLLSGAGALIKNNTGTLTLSGASGAGFTGPVTISGGGAISVNPITNLGNTGVVTLDNGRIINTNTGNAGSFISSTRPITLAAGGGTLEFQEPSGNLIIYDGVISGPGGLTTTGPAGAAISMTGNNTYAGPTLVASGILRVRTTAERFPDGTALTVNSGAIFDLNGLNETVGSVAGAGNVNINGNSGSAATFTSGGNNTSTTFAGLFTQGTVVGGRMVKAGSGILTLTGTASTYSGTTTVNNGTLAFTTIANVSGGNTSLGAPTSAVNGTIAVGTGATSAGLQYIGSANATTDRVINLAGTTGGATLDASGTGTITFTSNLTATGGGSKTLTLTGTNTGANTISGIIPNNSGTNTTTLTKTGAGTWVLTGANTFTGATNLNGGVLQFAALNNLGAGTAINFGGGTLRYATGNTVDVSARTVTFNSGGATVDTNGNNVTFANPVGNSGAGAFTKTGAGTLVLGAANTYTGATNLNGGVVQFATLNNLGAGTAINFDGGTLRYATGNTTDITARTVTLNAGGGTIDTNGNDVALNNPVGGTGGLTKAGGGALILTGTNTYTGTTTVSAGTLRIGAGGSTGSVAGNIVNNASLVFDRADTYTYAGILSGTGDVTQGNGTVVLTGNNNLTGPSGINVNAGGILLVNGQTGSNTGTGSTPVFVNGSAILGGTGRIGTATGGAVTVNPVGILQPGDANAVGTLTIASGLVMDNSSALGVRITLAGSSAAAPGSGASSDSLTSPTNHNYLVVTGATTSINAGMIVVADGTGVTFDPGTYSYKVAQTAGLQSAVNITNQLQFAFIGIDATNASLTDDGSGGIYLNFTVAPVPEPGTVLAVAAAGLGFGGLVRRRFGRRVAG